MNISQRVMICRLLEKMGYQAEYSKKIGLEDTSYFRRDKKDEGKK